MIHHIEPKFSQTKTVKAIAERTLFNSTRLSGVEVEFNNCGDFTPIKAFCDEWGAGVHSDGSCGWEAVTIPAAGNHLIYQLKDLGRAFKEALTTADERCGVHVHVDARDLYWPEMIRLLKLYSKVEPALYILGGQERTKNTYSKPVGKKIEELFGRFKEKPEDAVFMLGSNITTEKRKQYAKDGLNKKPSYRYAGLNICPWLARHSTTQIRFRRDKDIIINGKVVSSANHVVYGWQNWHIVDGKKVNYKNPDSTVEFRIHKNCIDAGKLIPWIKLCVRLVEYATIKSDREIDKLPRDAFRILFEVAPDIGSYALRELIAWRRKYKTNQRLIGYNPSLGYSIGKLNRYFPNRVVEAPPPPVHPNTTTPHTNQDWIAYCRTIGRPHNPSTSNPAGMGPESFDEIRARRSVIPTEYEMSLRVGYLVALWGALRHANLSAAVGCNHACAELHQILELYPNLARGVRSI